MKMKFCAASMVVLLLACAFGYMACKLDVAAEVTPKPIIRPYLSIQPASNSYVIGEAVANLNAQIWDWDSGDGDLSYQWYRFTDLAAFVSSGSGTSIPGAGASINLANAVEVNNDLGNMMVHNISLSLNSAEFSAKGNYYYYLEISNSDSSATDTTRVTVRSEIATLSFSTAAEARYPLIERQPAGAEYQFARNLVIAPLSVRASSAEPGPDKGELSFQWYQNTTGSTAETSLNAITGETTNAFVPSVEMLEAGSNYIFVKVTNTLGNGDAQSLLSVPAKITMKAGVAAMNPIITVQPKDGLYFTANEVSALTVDNERAWDGGSISYQWYSNTIQEARNGTAISGQTGKTYTPANTSDGIYYYYAVVTNTNNAATSVKKATAVTRAAKVVFGSAHNPENVHVTVTVGDPRLVTQRYQYIRGYGGMDTAWANFPEQKPEDMELMYNPDWGLGYNINRIMISPANTNINITMRDLVINGHRPHYYENVKIVNKYNGYNEASPWSPPKEWKSNNSINGGGHLVHTYYQQYANYLKAFAKHMYDAGAPIYCISISNEPNYTAGYDGCEWTPEEMRDFFKQVGRFTTGVRGFGGGRDYPYVLTVNGESANTPYINIPALADPVSRANIDMYARHVYGSTGDTLWRVDPNTSPTNVSSPSLISASIGNQSTINNILRRPDGTFYEVWMTEHNINSANNIAYPNDSTWNYVWRFMNDVDLVMRMNNENAFVWWASKRFYSMIGDGQFNTRDGAVLPRGWGLSHYAKYTNDTHRLSISIPRNSIMKDGTEITSIESSTSVVNNTSFNLDNNAVRITAYAHIESGSDNQPIRDRTGQSVEPGNLANYDQISYISLVMMTPTSINGSGGRDVGNIEIKMPNGFLIGGVSAHRSGMMKVNESDPAATERHFVVEDVKVSQDRTSAYVTLGPSQILSVKLTRQQ